MVAVEAFGVNRMPRFPTDLLLVIELLNGGGVRGGILTH